MGHHHKHHKHHKPKKCCRSKPVKYCYSYIEAPKWSISAVGTIVPNSSDCFPDYEPCRGPIMCRSNYRPQLRACCGTGSSCCTSTSW